MQRRDFLVSATLVPGLSLVPGVAGALTNASPASTVATRTSASIAATALHPVVASAGSFGTQLELLGGFQVARAFDVFHGALPFVIEGEGQRFQLDVLRRAEGGESGLHASEHFVVVAHGESGPSHERGARMLALALEREIQRGTAMPALATFEERRAAAGTATLHVDFARADERDASQRSV